MAANREVVIISWLYRSSADLAQRLADGDYLAGDGDRDNCDAGVGDGGGLGEQHFSSVGLSRR